MLDELRGIEPVGAVGVVDGANGLHLGQLRAGALVFGVDGGERRGNGRRNTACSRALCPWSSRSEARRSRRAGQGPARKAAPASAWFGSCRQDNRARREKQGKTDQGSEGGRSVPGRVARASLSAAVRVLCVTR